MYCKSKSGDIVKKLKQNKELDEVDCQKIKNLIVARKRLNYNTFHVFEFIFWCVIWRQRNKRFKSHDLFSKAEDKINKQLDVVNILRWIEQLKLLSKGLLNHKQKFWLKLQKEHLLDLDYNSEDERKKKKKDNHDFNDLIDALHKSDKKAFDKVKKMIKYLQNGNRTTFDLKIIQGLFKEYVSDSDDEVKAERALNTEEEYQEFYSLKIGLNDDKGKRGKNRRGTNYTGLKELYSKNNGLVSLGQTSPPPQKACRSQMSRYPLKKLSKSKSIKRKDTGILSLTDTKTTDLKKTHNKVYEINEDVEEEFEEDTENEKAIHEFYPQGNGASIMDDDIEEDSAENDEDNDEEGNKTKGDSSNICKSSSAQDLKNSSKESNQKANSEEEKQDDTKLFKVTNKIPSKNRSNNYNDPSTLENPFKKGIRIKKRNYTKQSSI